MVEDYSSKTEDKSRELIKKQIDELNDWVRPLQRALPVEVDCGYGNLKGRNENFNSFLSRELKTFRSSLFDKRTYEKLNSLGDLFDDYSSLSKTTKHRLIINTRQYLERLRSDHRLPSLPSTPQLRLPSEIDSTKYVYTKAISNLNLSSCLSGLKGVGLKMLEILASLGINQVRDLLLYYPRDYVDYSALKTISSLEPGQTATVVATIRKSSSFTSPRNSKLSVLELQLEDVTGRIKITRFFIGKRFSNRSF